MTYLELLQRIKNGTPPKEIRSKYEKNVTYYWHDGVGYIADSSGIYDHIHDDMDDIALATDDYIESVN